MSGHAKKLTVEQIDQLLTWREAGRGYRTIARRLKVSAGAVYSHCLKNGVSSPGQRFDPIPTEASQFVAGDGRTQRKFTVDDDARLLELEATGMAYKAIGREMGRPYTSVRIRLMSLAMREELAT
jgi:hypothetical protein